MNDAIDDVREDLPQLFIALKQRALNGDREAAIYLIDRVLGKPKQQTDIDISGGSELGAGLIVQLFTLLEHKRRELEAGQLLLKEGKEDAIQK